MLDNYEWFKAEILKLTKIDLNFYKEKQMRRRIDTLVTKNGVNSYEDYVALIKRDKALFEQFVNFLTINVSEFYRNPDQWKLMDENVIPKILANNNRQIKIWSAACSTGDEPYSLAMAFSKHVPLSNIKILATDIDKQVIQHAQVGLYNAKSIAGVPEDMKKKYFTQVGASYKIADEIKKCVEFKEHNLLKDIYPKDFDLILCRNVVIYFTDEAKDMIYEKFYESLKKKGVLFIGSTEQISNYKDIGFERLSSFYFQKPE
ncbi:MAG: protein-glutamate O-methyltransferase CheR [Lachnospiraceae bacterium]|nr:protein-glutamate O-methyltransferase CheR [Lachnospiraceae bacterium]